MENACNDTSFFFTQTALHSSLENMKCLLNKNCPMDKTAVFEAAVENGDWNNLKWLAEMKCSDFNRSGILGLAVKQGSLENIKWLVAKGCPDTYLSKALEGAAAYGSLENMIFFSETRLL